MHKNKSVIVKPIFNVVDINIMDERFIQYTTIITTSFVKKLPEYFFPVLCQEEVYVEVGFYVYGLRNWQLHFASFLSRTTGDRLKKGPRNSFFYCGGNSVV
jgi:hypothetical protein